MVVIGIVVIIILLLEINKNVKQTNITINKKSNRR
jgi:hypothetical protein